MSVFNLISASLIWYLKYAQKKMGMMNMKFVVCVKKEGIGDLVDMTIGHVYEVVGAPDQHGMIRIIDQSGEDYLYPATCFEAVTLSDHAAQKLHDALSCDFVRGAGDER